MARLPDGRKPVFIEALIDEYLTIHPTGTDGLIHIGMVRLEVEAIKRGCPS